MRIWAGRTRTQIVLRGDSGFGRDIDERTTPPETGQIERGISYHKGCYLGQEIIERMRSHNTAPRRLVKLQIDGAAALTLPAEIRQGDVPAGKLTSLAHDPVARKSIGLGYVRASLKYVGGFQVGDGALEIIEG